MAAGVSAVQNGLRQRAGHRVTLAPTVRRKRPSRWTKMAKRQPPRSLRVHRRVTVAVSRVRHRRAPVARGGLHRTDRERPWPSDGPATTSRCARARWWRGRRAPPERRSASSAGTPTARTCGSSSIPDRVRRGLAGGGAAAVRRRLAELLAGPRPRHQRPAVAADRPTRIEDVLVRIDDPILRVPQLAIHLSEDRKGVELDPQRHLNAVWGSRRGHPLLRRLRRRARRRRPRAPCLPPT